MTNVDSFSAHTMPVEEIFKHYSTGKTGLTNQEAEKRLQQFGGNQITSREANSIFSILLAQFNSPMVYMLLVAAGLSFYFKEELDAIAILVVLVINTVIGFVMEFQSHKAMSGLRKMVRLSSKVLRDGQMQEISSEHVVPGDVLFVEAGDMISADARIFQSEMLQADEASLTGESMPVEKVNSILPEKTNLADRANMLYRGTFITKGNATAVVTATGMSTELGQIAAMVASADQSATPLEKKIAQFSKRLIRITIILIIVIFVAGLLNGNNFIKVLETSIALAVAAIPEGLPIVATLALAQGMIRMARKKVLVKRLEAVETLGGTTVICTDKTGTLTQNNIVVRQVILNLETNNSVFAKELLNEVIVLCNTADLTEENGNLKEIGDPLETGLLRYAYGDGVNIQSLRKQKIKVKEEPFSVETRMMVTVHSVNNKYFLAAKGSVERIIKNCTRILKDGNIVSFNQPEKELWINHTEKLAAEGLRIIAAAYNEVSEIPLNFSEDLIFLGLIGMEDPPREEVSEAIRECKSAGIKVVMVTGDHPATAMNIALRLGIASNRNEEPVHGDSMSLLENITEEERKRWIQSNVFARVDPRQKLDLVTVLQEENNVVGMTGDGVNDAPALKKADIGIAMGLKGTQVAQEVADIVLKDDSFSSVVMAVKQGRIIYENLRKFIIYLLSCNLSELFILSVAAILNLHFGLFALQILYINIVTDVLPALALGFTEGSSSIMKQPPGSYNEPIIDKIRWKSILVYSVVISICTLGAVFYTHEMMHTSEAWNPELCNNILFITLILAQIFHVFNMSVEKKSFYCTDVFRNKFVWYATFICLALTFGAYYIPAVAKVLSLYWPSPGDFIIMFGFSLLSMTVNQVLKGLKIIL